ncbi:hypothetical protein [Streptomyces sp. DSM 40750]|uniref:hypothetical protein n=1 Tax=Streptomyces sp. DSM 40750 TaxID=2801030 RepID=UPI00214BDFA6|nr:hypothetical protein [Streptomyces sp. DSM 40750]UUU24347.1 hypothetical protein JIX55_31145 [Streptomyces sp. DSM 40750]
MREAGTETVDGVRTTHYRGTVTTKGLRAAQAAAEDEANRGLRTNSLDQFVVLRVEGTLTMELWVDGDGRAKRYRVQGQTCALERGTWSTAARST